MTKEITRLAADSLEAYGELKTITDSVYAGTFVGPWSPSVLKILTAYGIAVERKKGLKVQVNVTIPKSTNSPSIAVGVRYMKDATHFAEDLHVFEEGVGITSHYKGAQERLLPEYNGTHHAPLEISEFLPDIQNEIDSIKKSISAGSVVNDINPSDIFTQSAMIEELKAILDEAENKTRGLLIQHPTAMAESVSKAVYAEATKKRILVKRRWSDSERLYEAKKVQIQELYGDDIARIDSQMKILDKLFDK